MLSMTGQLLNVFENPRGVTKEGREYGGNYKIQVLGLSPCRTVKQKMTSLT